ncbi:MAG: TetR family transcriptional regulator, partial [Anaerolineales bacterium]|nr:TetR family transcriptional regulator [Anaerolineales bacterium]
MPNLDEKLDPRVKRTRNLILQSFENLLAEKNFESISVQDVTDRAEINRATFYAHFQDKYTLLDYSINQMFMQEIDK